MEFEMILKKAINNLIQEKIRRKNYKNQRRDF